MSFDRPTVLAQLALWLLLAALVAGVVVYGLIEAGVVGSPVADRSSPAVDPELALARSLLVPPAEAAPTGDQLSRDPADLMRARALIERALERDPNDPRGYYLRGLLHFAERDIDNAEWDIRHSLSLAPRAVDSHMLLGTIQVRLRDFEGAEASFRRVTELQPTSDAAWHNLGQVLHLLGRDDEGVEAYRRKLEERERSR